MNYILLDTIRASGEDTMTLLMENPEIVIETRKLNEVPGLLRKVEECVAQGYWAAGFLSYEAGFAFLPHMPELKELPFPAIWFGLARNPQILPPGRLPSGLVGDFGGNVRGLKLNISETEYTEKIHTIRTCIEQGETYQVNFTMRYRGRLDGDHRPLFSRLRKKQGVSYAALIETPDWTVLSLSPELLFRKAGRRIVMRPMKGTSPRGRTVSEDEELAHQLRSSSKESSENLMIVDLLRNDLGKICVPGSVHVKDPLRVERYETVLQMTSTIEGELLPGVGTDDILSAVFPSGSVTGAPKVRTMQIIHELEGSFRGLYTGAIGYIAQDRSVFNVAIRTSWIDRQSGRIEMGVGSGILHEADPVREYRECELKGKFLTEPAVDFEIFETMLWRPDEGLLRASLHMERMLDSAAYFGFPVTREDLVHQLEKVAAELHDRGQTQRVRIVLHRDGEIRVLYSPLEPLPAGMPRVCVSRVPTSSEDPFLFHKTTHRNLYKAELQQARAQGCFDVLFVNERRELTEGAITNLYLEQDGRLYTPPVKCGLLNGTYRRHLLESNSRMVERVLSLQDLYSADAIFVSNALRGLIRVELTNPPQIADD